MKIINDLLKTKNVLEPILEAINKGRNVQKTNLENDLKSYENSILYYKKEIERYEVYAKEKREAIEKLKDKDNNWKMEDFINAIDLLKKNKNIEWVFISENMSLIIQTKPLLQYHGTKNKQLDEPVGRYAININLTNSYFQVFPLDFKKPGTVYYRHPNLYSSPGNLCTSTDINNNLIKMFQEGDYYGYVDLLILFLSTFPQTPGAHSERYWTDWLLMRQIDFKQNPWIDLKPVYTVGEVKKAEPIEFIINKTNPAINIVGV